MEFSFSSPKGVRKSFLSEEIVAGGREMIIKLLFKQLLQPAKMPLPPPGTSAFTAFQGLKLWSSLLVIAEVVWVSSIRNRLYNYSEPRRIHWKEARGFQGIGTTV